ncbi:MAG: carbohydrate ABC transporter permease [Propionicimonas sp.]|uniref:carbohydrate ABC transporter permease n=1 Tax=Propionicimonas sp. TaxID=1955623 RepID=UPI002B1F4557|nr:carbohydrate ABC transporter permease [Propionicimonas sp.]MEA4944680.1 carbohydrate ABC transporter permease [Propionicimonas sp.]MEA5052711.1 carbohydrate ABC transporter permease [Propionicimonas sp.]MEA5116634.1 carbohydrate ABC transporter permease [Propionicimonas sp.]
MTRTDLPVRSTRLRNESLHSWVLGLCGIAIGLIVLLPVIWMVLTAFKPEADVVQFPPSLFPRALTLQHFVDIWNAIPFARLYLNTIIFAGGVTISSLLFDSMMGYALARLEFRGRNAVFVLVMILLMVPFQVTLIPLYDLLGSLGLAGTLPGMIVPRMTNAFGIFFMRQFYLSLPKDLDEAARVDGASEWRIFGRIITPLARPALLTLGLFHFQYNWNDLLWPLIMSADIESSTLPAGLSMFVGQHVVEYGLLMAGSVLALAPVVIFFLVIQKSFVAGIATTGMK